MKYIVRVIVFHIFSLWLLRELYPGFILKPGVLTVFTAGATLALLMILVKPILKILFIPINIITFVIFSWVINVAVVYILTMFMPEVTIIPWTFAGSDLAGFIIPKISFSYIMSLVFATFIITITTNILNWISES
jgi:uncharacterized membrane protein YvlD (DUF360 family)